MSSMLSEHLALLSTAADGVAKLRDLILGLAISGKLVPQEEKEGRPTSAFDKHRIPRKKPVEQLLKKFEIPASWLWCEVGDVCVLRTGATPSTLRAENYGGDIRWLVSGDIHKREIHDCVGRITEEGISSSNCKILPENSVLIALNGQGKTRASVAILRVPAACNQSLVAMTPVNDEVLLPEFLYLNLRFRYYEIRDITGQKQRRGLNMGLVGDLSISLPPVAEQRRIVVKVNELMTLCDRLEAEQADAEAAQAKLVDTLLGTLTRSTDAADLAAQWQRVAKHFDTHFTTESNLDALKQTIVQLAVMGRLLPQDPNDEPSGELLERISQERARLEAEGICKKTNPMPVMEKNEQPFAVPEGWQWQRLGELVSISGGATLGRKLLNRKLVSRPYLRVANVQRGYLLLDQIKTIEVPIDEKGKYSLKADDLLITEGGDWDKVGRTAIWRNEIEDCLHQNHVFKARPLSQEWNCRWAEMYLNAAPARAYFAASSKQTTNLASINMTQLKACPFPVPPLAEQHRIVAKVDELMALCDRLKADLANSRNRQARLASTLIEAALKAA